MIGELAGDERRRIKRSGLLELSAEKCVELFDLAVASGDTQLALASFDLATLRPIREADLLPSILSSLVRVPNGSAASRDTLISQLLDVPEAEWNSVVLKAVRDQAAAVLGYPSGEAINPSRPFKELGIDSLGAVEFRNRLSSVTGLQLPATLVFSLPTPNDVARFVCEQVERERPSPLVALNSELDRVEEMLVNMSPSDDEEHIVLMRLRSLARSFPADVAHAEGATTVADIQSADAREMIDLLNAELGGTSPSAEADPLDG